MSRTSITYRSFRCPDGHEFRAAVRQTNLELYRPIGILVDWLPIPKCPAADCTLIGQELADPASRIFAQATEGDRFYAWLSPDGTKVSVPGYHGAKMPDRYARLGYMVVEGRTIQDVDRLDKIRARQTGNSAYNEANYSPEIRNERSQADYNDDLTSEV